MMARADSKGPGHGGPRASDADREQAIDSLKAAFVHGRLDKDEFDLRAGLALAAQTRADLAAVTADIPAEAASLPVPPERARPRRNPPVKTGAAIIVVAVDTGAFAAAMSSGPALFTMFLLMLAAGMTGTALVAALIRAMLWIQARHARRHGGDPPPPPGADASRSQHTPPAGLPGKRPSADPGSRPAAQAAPGAHPRPRRLSPPPPPRHPQTA